ncbi:MAG TPA: response regulator [Anaerolineaceae bacterium]|nr:response regulator [Anaerolineaceae bacterium]
MPKILIIEDDETMLSLLETFLQIEGFDVTVYSGKNIESPLRVIRQEVPEVILMDVHLQNGNGMEITRQIRKDPALKPIRVIMTSGMEMSHQSFSAGADGFLLKPYMPEDLVRMIRNHSAM